MSGSCKHPVSLCHSGEVDFLGEQTIAPGGELSNFGDTINHGKMALDQAVADSEKATICQCPEKFQGHKVKTAAAWDLPGHPLQQNEKVRNSDHPRNLLIEINSHLWWGTPIGLTVCSDPIGLTVCSDHILVPEGRKVIAQPFMAGDRF